MEDSERMNVDKYLAKVSVVMNCHNGAKTLDRAIRSVIDQSLSDWEIVFWDNMSNDGSAELARGYGDNRIRLFSSSELTSLYEARNLAISKCRGELVCFLDVDDFWHPQKLEEQVRAFENASISACATSFTIQNELTGKIEHADLTEEILDGTKSTRSLINNYSIGILTLMVRADEIQNYTFDPRFHIIGDFDFVIRLSTEKKILLMSERLATYTIHGANESIRKSDRRIAEKMVWYKERMQDYRFASMRHELLHYRYRLDIESLRVLVRQGRLHRAAILALGLGLRIVYERLRRVLK